MKTNRERRMLEAENLSVTYQTEGGAVCAVRGADLTLEEGKIVVLVGESGSGKSSLAQALVGMCPSAAKVAGAIRYAGQEITGEAAKETLFAKLRGKVVGSVFQETSGALHPLLRVGRQLDHVIRQHFPQLTKEETAEKRNTLLQSMELPQGAADAYPHELSGGQRQRVLIALAIAGDPYVLIADEPTAALDSRSKASVLELLQATVRARQMSMLYITHDLSDALALFADQVIVMYRGTWMEVGDTDAILHEARHPYTRRLIASAPERNEPGQPIAAAETGLAPREGACPYYAQCAERGKFCYDNEPMLTSFGTHKVRCHRAAEGTTVC